MTKQSQPPQDEQTAAALRESEARYRSLFDESPLARWVEDHSAVKLYLQELVANGVHDVAAYLDERPDEYVRCLELARTLDVNQAAVSLFEASSREDLIAHSAGLHRAEGSHNLGLFWAALLRGERSATYEDTNYTLGGRRVVVLETAFVPRDHEPDWDLVYIADVDITERKAAEASLRESEQRFRTLVESTPDFIYAMDKEERYTAANGAFCRAQGLEESQIIGQDNGQLGYPAELVAEWHALHRRVLEEGELVEAETATPMPDGTVHTFELVLSPVVADDGAIVGLRGRNHDITVRRQMEADLARSNRLLRTVYEVNEMIVRQTSVDALLTEACQLLVDVGGYEMAWIGICGQREKRVVPVAAAGLLRLEDLQDQDVRYDDSPRGQGPSGEVIRTARPYLCEDAEIDSLVEPWRAEARRFGVRSLLAVPIRAGEEILGTFSIYATEPKVFGANEVTLLDGLSDDLGLALKALEHAAAREDAESALRSSERRYRRMIETASEGIAVLDAERHITLVNQELCDLLGYSAEELSGASLDVLLFPEDASSQLRRWAERRRGVTGRHEARLRRKDGSPRWVLVSARPTHDERGRFTGTLSMITDIHERKLAERHAARTLERLRISTEAAVRTLARTVELRDPYTAGHQERTSELAVAIGQHLGLRKPAMTSLRIAALIHDLGKIAIPAEILSKPGKLSQIEWNLIAQHPQNGSQILREMKFPGPVATIVHQHHERLDGSGYPDGLVGDEILREARILAVADVVEAMASHRPYRAAPGIDAALREIESSKGTLYDPEVVDACLALFRDEGFVLTPQMAGPSRDD